MNTYLVIFGKFQDFNTYSHIYICKIINIKSNIIGFFLKLTKKEISKDFNFLKMKNSHLQGHH